MADVRCHNSNQLNFLRQLYQREEDLVYKQKTLPPYKKGDHIWMPSSSRYKQRATGKKVTHNRNLVSDQFPLPRRGVDGTIKTPFDATGEPSKKVRPSSSQSALRKSGVMRTSARSARSGMSARSGRSSMPPSARSFMGKDSGRYTGRSSASRASGTSMGSSVYTGRSVSTEIINELRDRKQRLLEELQDLEELENEAIELQSHRSARSGYSLKSSSRRSRRSGR